MHCSYIFLIFCLALTTSYAKVLQEVPEVTRNIHGSYGAFRDFTVQDCAKSYENKWMRCDRATDTPAFIYYWNNKLKGCERVIYKGCGATRNNFINERACNNQAKPICL